MEPSTTLVAVFHHTLFLELLVNIESYLLSMIVIVIYFELTVPGFSKQCVFPFLDTMSAKSNITVLYENSDSVDGRFDID
jgi:hypothetical protein